MTNDITIAQGVPATPNIVQNLPTATIVIDPESLNTVPISEDMLKAFNYSQVIQILAGLDIVISLIYAFYNNWFFIPLCISLIGFLGAKKYHKCYSMSYFAYVLLNSFSRLAVFIYAYNQLSKEDQSHHVLDFIIVILGCMMGVYIAKIIYIFIKNIDRLSHMEKEYLIINGIRPLDISNTRSTRRVVFLR